MIVTNRLHNRGRKARIGGLCFDEGRMMIFVGYHTYPDGSTGKVLVSIDEAREFATRFGSEKADKRKQLIRWLVRRYGV